MSDSDTEEEEVSGLESDEDSNDVVFRRRHVTPRIRRQLAHVDKDEQRRLVKQSLDRELPILVSDIEIYKKTYGSRVLYLLRRFMGPSEEMKLFLRSIAIQPNGDRSITYHQTKIIYEFVLEYRRINAQNQRLHDGIFKPKFAFLCAALHRPWMSGPPGVPRPYPGLDLQKFIIDSYLFILERPHMWQLMHSIYDVSQPENLPGDEYEHLTHILQDPAMPVASGVWLFKSIPSSLQSPNLEKTTFRFRGPTGATLDPDVAETYFDDYVAMHIHTFDNKALFTGFFSGGFTFSANVLFPPNIQFVWQEQVVEDIYFYNPEQYPNAIRDGEIVGEGIKPEAHNRVFFISTIRRPSISKSFRRASLFV